MRKRPITIITILSIIYIWLLTTKICIPNWGVPISTAIIIISIFFSSIIAVVTIMIGWGIKIRVTEILTEWKNEN